MGRRGRQTGEILRALRARLGRPRAALDSGDLGAGAAPERALYTVIASKASVQSIEPAPTWRVELCCVIQPRSAGRSTMRLGLVALATLLLVSTALAQPVCRAAGRV